MTNPVNTSDLKTTDAAIMLLPGRLMGVTLLGDGTNAASLVIYDSPSAATGKVLAKINLDAGLVCQDLNIPNHGIIANQGLYADVTGTGAEYIVYFTIS